VSFGHLFGASVFGGGFLQMNLEGAGRAEQDD
jgi:hypothetical protein